MSDTDNTKTDFDWSPLGEEFWRNAGETAKATPVQVKFSCCLHRGMTMKASAATAGYNCDSEDALRKTGSRAAASVAVRTMLAMAVGQDGGTKVADYVDQDEARKILSNLARRGDATTKIRALEQLNRMAEAAKAKLESQDAPGEIETLLECCRSVPTGHTAVIAMGVWIKKGNFIGNFPHLKTIAPVVAKNYPKEWAWIISHDPEPRWQAFFNECASGPVIEGDELVSVLGDKIKRWRRAEEPAKPNKRSDPNSAGNGHVEAYQ